MTAIRIEVTQNDQASGFLEQLRQVAKDRRVFETIGTDVSQLVIEHLYRMDDEHPNRLGGVRTHFYGRAADLTRHSVDGTGTTISIGNPGAVRKGNALRQRIKGGVIRPVEKKALAIPIHARAHGNSPADFPNLSLVVLGDENKQRAYLAEKDSDGEITDLLFALRKSARQKGDRTLLPSRKKILDTAKQSITDFLAFLKGR